MVSDGEDTAVRRNGKSEAAFRTISEVAEDLELPQHVLRFWEGKFTQVRPLKRGGGRRYYRPEDVALLRRIRDLLYSEGYTIKGVQKLLREGGGREAPATRQNALALPLPVDGTDEDKDEDGDEDEDEDCVTATEPFDDGEGDAMLPDEQSDEIDPCPPPADRPAEPAALTPKFRRELEALRDELEHLRRLLKSAY